MLDILLFSTNDKFLTKSPPHTRALCLSKVPRMILCLTLILPEAGWHQPPEAFLVTILLCDGCELQNQGDFQSMCISYNVIQKIPIIITMGHMKLPYMKSGHAKTSYKCLFLPENLIRIDIKIISICKEISGFLLILRKADF